MILPIHGAKTYAAIMMSIVFKKYASLFNAFFSRYHKIKMPIKSIMNNIIFVVNTWFANCVILNISPLFKMIPKPVNANINIRLILYFFWIQMKYPNRYVITEAKMIGMAIADFEISTIEMTSTSVTNRISIFFRSINGPISNNIPMTRGIDEP